MASFPPPQTQPSTGSAAQHMGITGAGRHVSLPTSDAGRSPSALNLKLPASEAEQPPLLVAGVSLDAVGMGEGWGWQVWGLVTMPVVDPTICLLQEEGFPSTPDRLFKIVFVGNSSVGKTSFLGRFCDGRFSPGSAATVGEFST